MLRKIQAGRRFVRLPGFVIPSLFLCGVAIFTPVTVHADPYADIVVSFNPAPDASFGHADMPDIVLGPPEGGGELVASIDVASLGDSGSITLGFSNYIVDGPGIDFTVFENAFYIGADPLNPFAETARVEVSQNGTSWLAYPMDFNASALLPRNRWQGMAGIQPVFSNTMGGPSATDPVGSGGDQFDLADLGLPWVQFVRLTDTGGLSDRDGEIITDSGGIFGGSAGGFDLDAVVAVNSSDTLPSQTPTPPPATPTPTSTPQPAITPTPTGIPLPKPGAMLQANDFRFGGGDTLVLDLLIINDSRQLQQGFVYVAMEVLGQFYFHPRYTESAEVAVAISDMLPQEELSPQNLLTIPFTQDIGTDIPVTFYSALIDAFTGDLVGEVEDVMIVLE